MIPVDVSSEKFPIPDATAEPAAYVQALLDVIGDRDPLDVLSRTAGEIDRIMADEEVGRLQVRPEHDEWSFQDVLGHLLDVDIVYGFRLRLALTADLPTYPGYDEKGFSQLTKLDVFGLATAFRWLRTANLALLRTLTPEQLDRKGMHGEQGLEDVGLMVRKLAGHDIAHLHQMRRAVRHSHQASEPDISSVERLLRQAESAFSNQDLDAISALFTDDVVARYAGSPDIHGKAQLRKYLEGRLGRQTGYRPVKTLVTATGNVVVDSWEGTWIDPESNQPMAGRGMEVLKLRDGLVAELDAVFLTWRA